MEEKNIPENTADIDTVSGDNENTEIELIKEKKRHG